MSWEYFSYEGDVMLACPCCGKQGMDGQFMREVADPLRNALGFGLSVNSGYRCPDYNEQLSSTGRTGPHTTGRALDIRCTSSHKRHMIVKIALAMGLRVTPAKTFIHIDNLGEADGFTPDVMWWY